YRYNGDMVEAHRPTIDAGDSIHLKITEGGPGFVKQLYELGLANVIVKACLSPRSWYKPGTVVWLADLIPAHQVLQLFEVLYANGAALSVEDVQAAVAHGEHAEPIVECEYSNVRGHTLPDEVCWELYELGRRHPAFRAYLCGHHSLPTDL